MANQRTRSAAQHLLRAVLQPDPAGLTDGQLLACYLERRDEAAFTALVRRLGPMVLGVCRRVLRGHHDAEDAFQATFLVLARKAASVVPRDKVAHWLYGVARTTALRVKVALARRQAREQSRAELPEPEPPRPGLWVDLLPLLDEELNRLPAKYRVPIILCDLEGKTQKEAARQLGWPEGTVAGRLARGRDLLAGRLARHGSLLTGAALGTALAEGSASAVVPAALADAAVRAAQLAAVGQTAAVVSAQVALLAEGVLKSMFLTKLGTAAGVLLLVGLLLGAAGFVYHDQAGAQPNPIPGQAKSGEPPRNDPQQRNQENPQPPLPKVSQLKVTEQQLVQMQADIAALKKRLQEVEAKLKVAAPDKPGKGKLIVKVFGVAGIVGADVGGRPAGGVPMPGGEGPAPLASGGEALVRIITKTVEPETWDVNDGLGSIEYFAETKSLVIRQTPEVLIEVARLLQELAEMRELLQKPRTGKDKK
ncbi:MAG: sigma-70 family RNA polymerase sigma factor [Gemmataceae bacterium]|nr:sigma-70 family RNA polymerase sigma factor [Gemmataceae bacterium]